SIPAIKAVELGDGWRNAELFGSQVHDPMDRGGGGVLRETNHAGGLEGGVTNGEPLVARAAMKPIATVPAALRSVDLATGAPDAAHVERSDTCAVPAAAVVGEAVVALAVADALLAKLGGDSLEELSAALRIAWRRAAARAPRSVVALGGGALTSRAVRHWMRRTGHLLWLRGPADLCASRAPTGRPLLGADPQRRMVELAAARDPLYARLADAVVDI